jgi:ribosomal-protein-alanine N-acetyltransferase
MLKGELVVLRPFRREDLEDYHRWCSDYEALGPFQPWREERLSFVKLEKEFQDDGFISEKRLRFIVETRAGKKIGFVGAEAWAPAVSADVGCIIGEPSERGKGCGSEATSLLVNYLFATRPIVRLEAWTWTENAASNRALAKSGFRREGISRKCVFFAGEYRDMAIYSILREEWESLDKGA